MIDISNATDDILLTSIEEQHAYHDTTSYEKFTNKIKRKYKLAVKPIELDQIFYIFFVLTTNDQACQRVLTVIIDPEHWENRHESHLMGKSFLDIKKIDALTEEEVLCKIRDPRNKFLCAARLCDAKYEEVRLKKDDLHRANYLSDTNKMIIENVLSEGSQEATDKILRGLELN